MQRPTPPWSSSSSVPFVGVRPEPVRADPRMAEWNQMLESVRGERNQMEESVRVEMEESVRVEMEDSSRLVDIYTELDLEKEMQRWKKTSIYRVPAHIKNKKYSSAYRPQLVSLGPFHHGDTDLSPMVGHKHRALLHLVMRADTKNMGVFVAAVKEEADQLEAAYGQDLDPKWRGDNGRASFVDMMVTDGCFLLEAMRMIESEGRVPTDYDPNDPVFSKHGYLYLKNVILADMFVMQNQLPMLLLEKLALLLPSEIFPDVGGMVKNMVVAFFGLTVDNSRYLGGHSHPIYIARNMLCGESESHANESRERQDTMPSFLKPYIDIARKIFLKPCAGKWRERKDTMPSAQELYEAGIHFKASRSRSLLDIDFQRGVLSMPVLRVNNYVRTVFLNLMAFEQLHPGAGNGVTEYLIFMDHIIDSAKDVALLRSKGVMDCALGSDKEVAELFNTLSKEAVMDHSKKLQGVRQDVNAYCRKPWNKWRASLVHTYFRNPWVFFSLVAAGVLLVATLLQTIFTIRPLR